MPVIALTADTPAPKLLFLGHYRWPRHRQRGHSCHGASLASRPDEHRRSRQFLPYIPCASFLILLVHVIYAEINIDSSALWIILKNSRLGIAE